MYRIKIWKNNEDGDGDTKLHFAAAYGESKKLLKYIKLTCNINCENKLGWTPLMLSCRNGHLACARTLIKYGAQIFNKNKFGVCSLSLASSNGNVEIVSLVFKNLVENVVHVSELEKSISPAIFSILFSNIDVLNYLIKNSFDLRRNNFVGGLSSIQFAQTVNNSDIIDFLKHSGLSPMSKTSRQNCIANSSNTKSPTSSCSSSRPPPLIRVESPTVSQASSSSSCLVKTPYLCRSCNCSRSPKVDRLRNCTNAGASSSSIVTLSRISPISIKNSSLFLDHSDATESKPENKNSNQQFRYTPIKLNFSSTSSSDLLYCKPNSKERCSSCHVPANTDVPLFIYDESSDEIFEESSPVIIKRSKEEFVQILRRHSLDSCISLFTQHEIDMDLFMSLSRSDLEEIGINWNKRDTVLEVIYHLNKK